MATFCPYNGSMKTVLNVKIDQETKTEAQKIAKELGLSLSAIVNAQLKDLVRDKTVVYSTKPTERMSPKLEAMIGEVEEDIRLGRDLGPILSSREEIEAYFAALEKEAAGAHKRSSKTRKTTFATHRS